MSIKVRLPLYLNWKALKAIGWPYGRAQTGRLENDPKYHKGRPFPKRGRPTGGGRHAHPLWYSPHVLDYFKQHGLPIPEEVEYSF
jgi:hypothetical protein